MVITIELIVSLYLRIIAAFKWLVSKTPNLIHDTPKAPHITGSGVLLVVYSLFIFKTAVWYL